eukprot:GHVT01060045.1.p1 GENE.GHVT01060045.1~~GHVT01060045.1.p1  ORF type:complete len:706 (-),score=95.88 GHVT01060045.1:1753-3870(-)
MNSGSNEPHCYGDQSEQLGRGGVPSRVCLSLPWIGRSNKGVARLQSGRIAARSSSPPAMLAGHFPPSHHSYELRRGLQQARPTPAAIRRAYRKAQLHQGSPRRCRSCSAYLPSPYPADGGRRNRRGVRLRVERPCLLSALSTQFLSWQWLEEAMKAQPRMCVANPKRQTNSMAAHNQVKNGQGSREGGAVDVDRSSRKQLPTTSGHQVNSSQRKRSKSWSRSLLIPTTFSGLQPENTHHSSSNKFDNPRRPQSACGNPPPNPISNLEKKVQQLHGILFGQQALKCFPQHAPKQQLLGVGGVGSLCSSVSSSGPLSSSCCPEETTSPSPSLSGGFPSPGGCGGVLASHRLQLQRLKCQVAEVAASRLSQTAACEAAAQACRAALEAQAETGRRADQSTLALATAHKQCNAALNREVRKLQQDIQHVAQQTQCATAHTRNSLLKLQRTLEQQRKASPPRGARCHGYEGAISNSSQTANCNEGNEDEESYPRERRKELDCACGRPNEIEISVELRNTRALLEEALRDQAVINDTLAAENFVARWLWRSGKLFPLATAARPHTAIQQAHLSTAEERDLLTNDYCAAIAAELRKQRQANKKTNHNCTGANTRRCKASGNTLRNYRDNNALTSAMTLIPKTAFSSRNSNRNSNSNSNSNSRSRSRSSSNGNSSSSSSSSRNSNSNSNSSSSSNSDNNRNRNSSRARPMLLQ